jgi:hypothetical protein
MKTQQIVIFIILVFLLSSCEKNDTPANFPNLSIDSLKILQTNIPGGLYTDLTFINEKTGFAISNFGAIIKQRMEAMAGNNYYLMSIFFLIKSNSPIVRLVILLVVITPGDIF